MSFNNGFPIGYQPVQPAPQVQMPNGNIAQNQQQMYQQPVVQQAPQQQSERGGIIWVQGEAGAKSYLVAPNQSVMLMDSEKSCFYIKSADASGMPLPLRTFDYSERIAARQPVEQPPENEPVVAPTQEIDLSNYMTRDEFEDRTKSLLDQINDLTARLTETTDQLANGKRRK